MIFSCKEITAYLGRFITLSTWQWRLIFLGLAALPCLALIYSRNPEEPGVFPPCVFYSLTGLQCPGCGTLRALHYLMHGNLSVAFGHHPGIILVPPFIGCTILLAQLLYVNGKRLPSTLVHPAMMWGSLAAIAAFGVLRNLPIYPSALSAS